MTEQSKPSSCADDPSVETIIDVVRPRRPIQADVSSLVCAGMQGLVSSALHSDVGHPWDGRPGFDHLEVFFDSEQSRDASVSWALNSDWKCWISGFQTDGDMNPISERPCALFYKPSGWQGPWDDSPSNPHPGCTNGVLNDIEHPAWRQRCTS